MKKFKVIEAEDNRINSWSDLENAIHETINMAHMLASVAEEGNDTDGREDALVFGIYRLHDMCKETKEAFRRLHDEVRAVKLAREEVVPIEEDEPDKKMKVVGLH